MYKELPPIQEQRSGYGDAPDCQIGFSTTELDNLCHEFVFTIVSNSGKQIVLIVNDFDELKIISERSYLAFKHYEIEFENVKGVSGETVNIVNGNEIRYGVVNGNEQITQEIKQMCDIVLDFRRALWKHIIAN